LRFFGPQGQRVAPMGVKFGMPEGTKGPLLHAKFHPHRCKHKGTRKLKFLLRFDQNVAHPLRDFYITCRVCTPFQDVLAVKISLDLLKGLWSYGRFELTGSGYPQIFSAP